MRYHRVIPWRRHLFLDCGGYDGCSIRRFIKDFDRDGRFEIVTFEPNDLYATCYADPPMPDAVSSGKIFDHLIKRCATAAPILLFHVFLHFVKLSTGDDYETELGETNELLT